MASAASDDPAAVSAGRTGSVAAYGCYADGAKTVAMGTETLSFAVTAAQSARIAAVSVLAAFVNTSHQSRSSAPGTATSCAAPPHRRVEAFLPRHAAMFGATAPGMVCRKPRLDPDSGAKISFPEGKFCWNHPGSFGGLKYCRIHQADFPAT